MIPHAWYFGKRTLAASVSRGVDNDYAGGVAYIGWWDMRGSQFMRQLVSAHNDAKIMRQLMTMNVRVFVEIEAGLK